VEVKEDGGCFFERNLFLLKMLILKALRLSSKGSLSPKHYQTRYTGSIGALYDEGRLRRAHAPCVEIPVIGQTYVGSHTEIR
jgi:hypothetical protein